MKTIHQHPQDATELIEGRELQPGEILQTDDVYSPTTGKWEPIPEPFVGNTVMKGHGALLIRPGE